MDVPNREFVLAGSLEELKAQRRLVVHGAHRPILVIYDRGRAFALDNRCPHMGFPLERGSIEDGILTCHWHHARFDLESGCTFDLWADDVPIFPVELRDNEVWVKTTLDNAHPAAHWRQRLADGLAHDLGLVIAKAVHGQLAADVPSANIVCQVALFGAQNRDGWDVGLTILTALANLLPLLSEEEAYLALFHGARRVAADCDGEAHRGGNVRRLEASPIRSRSSAGCGVGGFHAYQMLEAGVRQFTVWGNTDEGQHILIAVARYLAGHSPTERAALQTADIAQRLMRGGELHQEEGASA